MSRTDSIRKAVRESYATPEAVAKYAKRADRGLATWEQAVAARCFPASGTVLTVGCGAGREAFGLEVLGYDVTGVDIVPALIEAANDQKEFRHSLARFALVDGAVLPFANAAFDVVTLWNQMLANVPTRAARAALMREVARVIRPAGIVCLSVHDDARSRRLLATESMMAIDDPEPGDIWHRELDEGTVRYMHYFTADEVQDLCTGCGFEVLLLCHTADLGQEWDNVFVVVATRN
jgi:SAM-dependent methyltransferase